MDYEKAYKEALERARNLMERGQNNELIIFPGQFIEIFPELGKSEDERTKEDLIMLIHELASTSSKIVITKLREQRFLAYLERHKEPNSDRLNEEYWRGYKEGKQCVEDKYKEKMLESITKVITHCDDLAHEPTFADPRWTHPYTKEISWLKSLRPQPKQGKKGLILTKEQEKEFSHLFTRPSWKPSEQEKDALRIAIQILTEQSFPNAVGQLQNILNAFEGKESRKN